MRVTIQEVTRHEQSVVHVRTVLSPVVRHLSDARALLRDEQVSDSVAERVVPGLLRMALEAACHQVVRRQRLASPGTTHADVERLLDDNTKLYPLLALALFDDEQKGSDVLNRLNGYGHWAGDLVPMLNRGAHGPTGLGRPALEVLSRDNRRLIEKLGEWDGE